MLAEIARIISTTRTRLGLSIDEVGQRAEISVQSLRALEAGQPGIATTELERLAVVLSLDPTALLFGRELDRALPSVFLRHASHADFNDSDLPVLDAAVEQGRALVALAVQLGDAHGIREKIVPRDAAGDRPDRAAKEGYELARVVRGLVGLPAEPLGDLRRMLEDRFDIAVVVARLASTRSTAVGVRQQTGAAAIVLNESDPDRMRNPALTRVHLAHELCHLLYDPSAGGVHLVVDVNTDRGDLLAEQRARGFAAEMLLPLAGLTQLLGSPKEVGDRARDLVNKARAEFNTPNEIAVNHLCNHRFIRSDLRQSLLSSAGPQRSGLPPTILPQAGAPSLLVAERVRRAHDSSLLTDGEARRLLGVDVLSPLPWDRD